LASSICCFGLYCGFGRGFGDGCGARCGGATTAVGQFDLSDVRADCGQDAGGHLRHVLRQRDRCVLRNGVGQGTSGRDKRVGGDCAGQSAGHGGRAGTDRIGHVAHDSADRYTYVRPEPGDGIVHSTGHGLDVAKRRQLRGDSPILVVSHNLRDQPGDHVGLADRVDIAAPHQLTDLRFHDRLRRRHASRLMVINSARKGLWIT
jgi:hypothetical protein